MTFDLITEYEHRVTLEAINPFAGWNSFSVQKIIGQTFQATSVMTKVVGRSR